MMMTPEEIRAFAAKQNAEDRARLARWDAERD